jgi:superoxide dismutase, Fe-Mn family
MRVHHQGHHAAYTAKTNAALAKLAETDPAFAAEGIDAILTKLDKLPADLRNAFRNAGGGYVNHRLFWNVMGPSCGGKPTGELLKAIEAKWGSYDEFHKEFNTASLNLFGSGWTWLYVDKTGSTPELKVCSTPNQDTPAMEADKVPILGLDLWEHAMYLKYQNKKGDYINAWWNVVNWEYVAKLFAEATA